MLHVRLQTWLPLTIQVCINGREYLARQMLAAGISYTQADNCFTAIGELQRAQQFSDQLVERKWKPCLMPWHGGLTPGWTAKASSC